MGRCGQSSASTIQWFHAEQAKLVPTCHVQSNVNVYKALPRKAISCWWLLKAKQPTYPTSVRGNVYDLFLNTLQWMKAIGSNHIQMHAEVNLPRTTYACFWSTAIPPNYFWHMPCDIPMSMVARCRWTKAHSSSLAKKSHIYKLTLHNDSPMLRRTWSQLSFSCKDAYLSTLWSRLWNRRKNPVRDERVRPYDERRWFEKRTYFIAMIFAMHPFHVFNTLFYPFWFVSHKFWQISSDMLSCGLQKLCFSRTRGSSPHGTRRQRRQERWPKNAEQKRFLAILGYVIHKKHF